VKSTTYSILVLLVFIRNIEKAECSSIKQLIQVTDKLSKKLGFNNTLSYMTKYYVVKELQKQGILVEGPKGYSLPISLSDKIRKYIIVSLSDVVGFKEE